MAREITITDPQTIKLIEREASRLGITETGYVMQLVTVSAHAAEPAPEAPRPLTDEEIEGRIPRAKAILTETPEERAARLAAADRILSELQAMMTDEDRAFDYNDWLYDENGLPH